MKRLRTASRLPYNRTALGVLTQESLRRAKFKGWPNGPDGQPALEKAFGGDVKAETKSMAKRELSESAMDAVFDSFVGSPLSIVADR